MDHLGDTNLNKLETIIQSVCPVLKEKINQFKALRGELPNIYTDSEAADTGEKMLSFKDLFPELNKEAEKQVE